MSAHPEQALATLVNGAPTTALLVSDRGLQYGDGVFETIAIDRGRPLLWTQHTKRLVAGCRALRFDVLPATDTLEDDMRTACANTDRGVLKIMITRGVGPRGYRPPGAAVPSRIFMIDPWPQTIIEKRERGVTVRICETRLADQPRLAGIKHLNRLEQVLARSEWQDEWDEGLMLDQRGLVIEGTMSNVFAVIDGRLQTPDVRRCGVAGIMRDQIISLAKTIGAAVTVADLSVDRLLAASEVFVTNSLIGIWPVRRLAKQRYPLGPLSQALWRGILDHAQPMVVV